MIDDNNQAAEPVADPAPVQVVSVDELVGRLVQSGEPAEGAGEGEPEEPSLADQWYTASLADSRIGDVITEIREVKYMLRDEFAAHDLLSTKFEDYTVTEGLLLSILLCLVINRCIKMLKGAFAWLLW